VVEDELELKLDELLLFDMLVADWPPAPEPLLITVWSASGS